MQKGSLPLWSLVLSQWRKGGELFKGELEIPARDTPEYITFLEGKLKSQRDSLVKLQEKNRISTMESQLRNINLNIAHEQQHQSRLFSVP